MKTENSKEEIEGEKYIKKQTEKELLEQLENSGGYGYGRIDGYILIQILKELRELKEKLKDEQN